MVGTRTEQTTSTGNFPNVRCILRWGLVGAEISHRVGGVLVVGVGAIELIMSRGKELVWEGWRLQ